uniref:Immunoglobulin V-set domain-containing protein n=1 Tax=Sander lucioperca TaxID=283035 RepID=A0A8D0CWR4_SANLU
REWWPVPLLWPACALLARNPPEVKTFYKTTGDNIIVSCFFSVSGSRMYFCREECEDKDILVQTTNVSVQSDRYSVRYVGGFVSGGYLYVKISQLTRADSGLYRCGLNTSFSPDPYQEFRIVHVHTETPTPRGTCTH